MNHRLDAAFKVAFPERKQPDDIENDGADDNRKVIPNPNPNPKKLLKRERKENEIRLNILLDAAFHAAFPERKWPDEDEEVHLRVNELGLQEDPPNNNCPSGLSCGYF